MSTIEGGAPTPPFDFSNLETSHTIGATPKRMNVWCMKRLARSKEDLKCPMQKHAKLIGDSCCRLEKAQGHLKKTIEGI